MPQVAKSQLPVPALSIATSTNKLFNSTRQGGLEVNELRPFGGNADSCHLIVETSNLRFEGAPLLSRDALTRSLEVFVGNAVNLFHRSRATDEQDMWRLSLCVNAQRDSRVGL